jgi:hypothetical protein
MPKHRVLTEILTLDPQKDYERIVFLMWSYEFPFDYIRSGELALFRTFGIPSISALLAKTGEFSRRTQKRYDDTVIILSQSQTHGYGSQQAQHAFSRMNQMHHRYSSNISNEEFLYVLSTFIYEPIRWNARFGWRQMVEQERLGLFYYIVETGRRMNIKNIPATYAEFEEFNQSYEREYFAYSQYNYQTAKNTADLLLSWFYVPKVLYPVGYYVFGALLDDLLLSAIGFPKPRLFAQRLVLSSLKLRAKLVRLLPERRKPVLHADKKRRSYPHGYQLDLLGTFTEDKDR